MIVYVQINVWEPETLNKEMNVIIYFISDAIYFYPEEVGKYEGDIDIQAEDITEVCHNNRYLRNICITVRFISVTVLLSY